MLENMKLALIILLTGIVVVFSVLLLLILIIKLYSTAVSSAQNSIEARKIEKQAELKPKEPESVPQTVKTEAAAQAQPDEDDGAIPGEIIAVIAAAVDTIFGEGAVTIQSVKKARPQRAAVSGRSAWRAAGMAENTRAF